MTVFDLILLFIIGGFGLFGFWFGFLHTLGSLLGMLLGAFIASNYYQIAGAWLEGITGWGGNISNVIIFILLFVIINRLVGIAFWLFNRAFKIISIVPFLKSINRLLGLIFGILEGAITIGFIIYFIERFPLREMVMDHIATSTVAPYTVVLASVLLPFIPEAIKVLESSVDYVKEVAENI